MSLASIVDEKIICWETLWDALRELSNRAGAQEDDPHLWGMRAAAMANEPALLETLNRGTVPDTVAACRRATALDRIGLRGQAEFLSLCTGKDATVLPRRRKLKAITHYAYEGSTRNSFDGLWDLLMHVASGSPLDDGVRKWWTPGGHDSLEDAAPGIVQRPGECESVEDHPDAGVRYLLMKLWEHRSAETCKLFGFRDPDHPLHLLATAPLRPLIDMIQSRRQEVDFLHAVESMLDTIRKNEDAIELRPR